MKRTLAVRDLYYLRSIKRQLDELAAALDFGPTIGTEVLADNRDWLADFIERMSPPTLPRSGGS